MFWAAVGIISFIVALSINFYKKTKHIGHILTRAHSKTEKEVRKLNEHKKEMSEEEYTRELLALDEKLFNYESEYRNFVTEQEETGGRIKPNTLIEEYKIVFRWFKKKVKNTVNKWKKKWRNRKESK